MRLKITRDGKPLTLTLNREFRPPFAETVVARAAPAPILSSPQIDTADELAKLAALKDKGIITADEFAAQKKKLLGN